MDNEYLCRKCKNIFSDPLQIVNPVCPHCGKMAIGHVTLNNKKEYYSSELQRKIKEIKNSTKENPSQLYRGRCWMGSPSVLTITNSAIIIESGWFYKDTTVLLRSNVSSVRFIRTLWSIELQIFFDGKFIEISNIQRIEKIKAIFDC